MTTRTMNNNTNERSSIVLERQQSLEQRAKSLKSSLLIKKKLKSLKKEKQALRTIQGKRFLLTRNHISFSPVVWNQKLTNTLKRQEEIIPKRLKSIDEEIAQLEKTSMKDSMEWIAD